MRERWFGATGRLVPEIAVEGQVELDDALVLDDVSDETALKSAHEQGRPVVVRADLYERIKSLFETEDLSGDEKRRLLAESGERAGWSNG